MYNVLNIESLVKVFLFSVRIILKVIVCQYPVLILTVPSGPPQSTDTQALSSTSLLLSWSDPLPDQQNGPIVGYLVMLVRVGTGDTTQFSVTATTLEVGSLVPYTTYEWRVAAETTAGTGPFSSPLTEQTLPDGMYYKV